MIVFIKGTDRSKVEKDLMQNKVIEARYLFNSGKIKEIELRKIEDNYKTYISAYNCNGAG